MNTNFNSFINNIDPNCIGKWEGISKNLVVYDGKEWKIEKFNIFQLLARKYLGFYTNTYSSNIKNQLKIEYRNNNHNYVDSGNIKKLIIIAKNVFQQTNNVSQLPTNSSSQASTNNVSQVPANSVSQIPSLIPQENYRQIQVLNQNYEAQGYERCGFHAFKNAFIGLKVALENADPKLFCDEAVFQDFYHFAVQFKSEFEEEGDVSIADLNQALEALKSKPEADIPQRLRDFQRICKAHPNSISMINLKDGNGSSFDETTLHFLANLVEMKNKPSPFAHAILIGENGHWKTLIIQKNSENSITWSECDSDPKISGITNFRSQIQYLKNIPNNLQLIQKNYYDAVGADIQRKAKWFSVDGVILPGDQARLIRDQQKYIARIISAFEFMSRVGWLNSSISQNDEIKGFIKDLKVLTNFFNDNVKDHPQLVEINRQLKNF